MGPVGPRHPLPLHRTERGLQPRVPSGPSRVPRTAVVLYDVEESDEASDYGQANHYAPHLLLRMSIIASPGLAFSVRPPNASFCCERTGGCRSARRSVVRSAAASRVRPAHVASEWPATQHHDDSPRAGRPYARRSTVGERAWGTWHTPRHTRRRRPSASTSPGAPPGRGQVPRRRHPRARVCAHPLRRRRPRVPARVFVHVSIRLPQRPREAARDLGAVARHHAPRARAAPASGPHDPEAAPRVLPVSPSAARRDRPRRRAVDRASRRAVLRLFVRRELFGQRPISPKSQ